eukprot:PhF_6_TR15452/c0_g1_i2/m.24005/K03845/ALG3; alpha-1,3-mannosyltransferase
MSAGLGLNAAAILLVEVVACAAIIAYVPYTEIDWKAYMEEVIGFVETPDLDYKNLKGGTGPLVYPAGFTYLYAALYYLTDKGTNIFLAQVIFAGIYVATVAIVLALYSTAKSLPGWVPFILIVSKRIHSLYVLRMFNDTVAMMILYLSILLIIRNKWWGGCTAYSLAVAVKMNVALFSPALLFVLLKTHSFGNVVKYIVWMGVVQLILGAPFMMYAPISYLTRAFELSRVFTYKWSVNFKFLDEVTFQSKPWALLLLGLTLLSWAILTWRWYQKYSRPGTRFTPRDVVQIFFEYNVVGITFSRTMHYQFYSWFFHQLPFVLWVSIPASVPTMVRLGILGSVEFAFNVFPATPRSSLMLVVSLVLTTAFILMQRKRTKLD